MEIKEYLIKEQRHYQNLADITWKAQSLAKFQGQADGYTYLLKLLNAYNKQYLIDFCREFVNVKRTGIETWAKYCPNPSYYNSWRRRFFWGSYFKKAIRLTGLFLRQLQ